MRMPVRKAGSDRRSDLQHTSEDVVSMPANDGVVAVQCALALNAADVTGQADLAADGGIRLERYIEEADDCPARTAKRRPEVRKIALPFALRGTANRDADRDLSSGVTAQQYAHDKEREGCRA